ncbi:MAG: hypothetical protein GEU74_06975 [Nitriliruptorales bacterium]|nr:hypothetical protein [Nitriliruptorales bacterium]
MRADPRVTWIESDELLRLSATQAKPVWGLDRIDQARLPLDRTYTYVGAGKGVTAYVVDSGLYAAHREFEDRVRRGYDATGGGSTADCNGHGTHVAATLGGKRYGVAKQVTLVPVRIAGCSQLIRKAHVLAVWTTWCATTGARGRHRLRRHVVAHRYGDEKRDVDGGATLAGAVARFLSRNRSASPATVAARVKKKATTGLVAYPGPATTTKLLYLRAPRPTRLGRRSLRRGCSAATPSSCGGPCATRSAGCRSRACGSR